MIGDQPGGTETLRSLLPRVNVVGKELDRLISRGGAAAVRLDCLTTAQLEGALKGLIQRVEIKPHRQRPQSVHEGRNTYPIYEPQELMSALGRKRTLGIFGETLFEVSAAKDENVVQQTFGISWGIVCV